MSAAATHANTVVVDWGTSAFRAWRIGAGRTLVASRADPAGGIARIAPSEFEAVLFDRLQGWLEPGTTVWLSGMVTSRNGWVEAPYVAVPAALADLAHQARRLDGPGGISLRFVPGVCQHEPSPDVMRGEEMQVFGQIARGGLGEQLFVLPGTHSKWVQVRDDTIRAFRTYLTGEMYALLVEHSIVGRLIPRRAAPMRAAAFDAGVRVALSRRCGGLLHDVFTARSAALLACIEPQDVADYLSGLLIGHELREQLDACRPGVPPVLIGGAALVARYRRAFDLAGVPVRTGDEDAAVAGMLALASIAAQDCR